MSGVVEKVKAKVDQVLHKDHTTGTTHTAGTHTANTHTATGHTGTHTGHTHTSTNAGPHESNVGNKLDPRVDSDRDGSHNVGAASYGPGGHQNNTAAGGYGQSGIIGQQHSTNAGPHDSNALNKLDPRVDSDGSAGHGTTGAGYGTSGSAGAYSHSTGTSGPHNTAIANKLDPRVDSDRDGSRNFGAATSGPGATHNSATGPARETAGPHSSNVLNKLDPRVDSDADGSRNAGAAQHGPGAHNTTSGSGFGGNTTY